MPEPPSTSSAEALSEPLRWHERDVRLLFEVLENFTAVVLGVVAPDGTLRRANAGLLRLITGADASSRSADDVDMRLHLVRPGYSDLAAGPPSAAHIVYRGPVTILDRHGESRSVRAIVLRVGDELVFFGEHELAEYERLIGALTELNDELGATQRTLVRAQRDLERAEAAQRELATTDPLTGLRNRRYVLERLREEVKRAQRTGGDLSVVLFDLDDLKRINDRHGHATGDAALEAVAAILRAAARGYDVAARFAGDEWLLLLPDTTAADALVVAQRAVEAARTTWVANGTVAVRLSAGAAGLAGPDESPEQLLLRADEALYRAKAEGRDRVRLAGASPDTGGGRSPR